MDLEQRSAVLRLVESFLGKGRIITSDNFFTSLKPPTALQAMKANLVGTLVKTKHELPPAKQQADLFNRNVFKCPEGTISTRVCILSTQAGVLDNNAKYARA